MHDAAVSLPSSAAPAEGAEQEPTDRIREAAERCFLDLGYDGTSVRAIANAAGVSKSLVLYHFQSKERLYAEVQMRLYDRLARSIRTAVAARGGTVVERGMVALDALLALLRERNDLAAHALLGARALSSPELRGQVERLRHELRQLLLATMGEVVGDARLPVSLASAAELLWAALAGIGLEAALDDDPARAERAFGAIRTLVELGLRSAGEGGRA
ncbi:MAG: TetR/AcrR family transcriptional regulator [Myxococcota bacterium]